MSGVKEGILLDLSEPVPSPPINILDSIEQFREDIFDDVGPAPSISRLSLKMEEVIEDASDRLSLPQQDRIVRKSPEFSSGFIDAEVFDFDLPVTPVTSSDKSSSDSPTTQDDEEEVFFGPVKYRERIAVSHIKSATKEHSTGSPLNDRQWAELYREANKVVKRLGKNVDPNQSKPAIIQKLFDQENIDPKLITLKTDCDIVDKRSTEACDRASRTEKPFSECLDRENGDTPSKRHNRSMTYTLDKTPLELLPDDMKNTLPVIESDVNEVLKNFVHNKTEVKVDVNDSVKMKVDVKNTTAMKVDVEISKDAENATERKVDAKNTTEGKDVKVTSEGKDGGEKKRPRSSGLSKLRQPSIKMKDRSCVPALQKLRKRNTPDKNTDKSESSADQPRSPRKTVPGQVQNKQPQEKLSVPKNQPSKKSPALTSGVPKSRLSLPKSGGIPTSNGSSSKLQKPSATGIVRPSVTTSVGKVNQPKPNQGNQGKAAPTSKLQLLKPSGLQRRSGLVKPGDSLKKAGPMKAFGPASQQAEQASSLNTPAKIEKNVKRKNLSASFSTPSKSSSCSSMESPMSSIKKRRSGLPTPNKARTSSVGCIPSPCPSRGSSISSVRSMDSPLVNTSTSKKRPSTASKSTGKSGSVSDINDKSPSSMMPKRQLVVNTPNLPKKKVSPWSPVQKKRPMDQFEEVTRCTKMKFK